MNRFLALLFLVHFTVFAQAAPLRVFIRGGLKSHGPGQHEHQRFLETWQPLLTERGMRVEGALEFPTPQQLAVTDVLVMYAQDGGNLTPEQRPTLEKFLQRGGGLVVIHTAAVANRPDTSPYWKQTIGGSWIAGTTKWREGPMDLYYVENQRLEGGHPITRGASNFHLDDEIYYAMDLAPDIRVLATSYTPKVREGKKPADGNQPNIYDTQPQLWTYERTTEGGAQPYRAFVSIPGHRWSTFELPQYRAILLRGIAWAARRANVDEFVRPEESSALLYPPGGPQKPADTLANLEVHPDFTMRLVAAEPLITKPMNFDWDPAGRMWVAETPEYPNGLRGMRPDYRGHEWKDHGGIDPAPGEQTRRAQDKISILIDTDGDGVADKKQVFYEGLDLVTGLVFYRDGVIVTQAPDILWLRDTDGDGKADRVEKLYTGLGTRDTHAVINNPRWGWDGWIYATHGYSSSSSVLNARGETQGTIGSGVVRFRPDGSKIEQYSSKGGNTWGLTITADNRVMWTQPTSGQLLMQTLLPETVLARGKVGNTASFAVVEPSPKSFPALTWTQLAYAQIDWVGSFTAGAGCAIYDGGTWPAEYNGDYFCTEPTINIIHHTRLTPTGSSFTARKLAGREETEFVRSRDMWWRPIEVRSGPDGALYVADFYNQAVIHNDTRGPDHNGVNAAVRPDRDHYFGRIWRIDHRDAKKLTVADLTSANVGVLATALASPNKSVRMTASRVLAERTSDSPVGGAGAFPIGAVQAALAPLLANADADTRVAALWTCFRTGRVMDEALRIALADRDAEVRRNAALIAEAGGYDPGRLDLSVALGDEAAPVRLAALQALASREISGTEARAIVAAWPKLDDDFQRSAAVGAAARGPVAVITAALENRDRATTLVPLIVAVTRGVTSADDAGKMLLAIATKPGPDELKRALLETLGTSLKTAPAITPELSSALEKLLGNDTPGLLAAALPLAARWDTGGVLRARVAELARSLLAQIAEAKTPEEMRLAAGQSLIGIRNTDPTILPIVVAQLRSEGGANFKRRLIVALTEVDEVSVGKEVAATYASLPADVQPAAFDAVLKRADWANTFLDAVQAGQVEVATLGPANAYRLRAHPDRAVAKRAIAMFDALNPIGKLKKDAIAKLLPVVEQKGDPARGKQLFTVTCAICHRFGDFGADIGPGLTGMGAHAASELLGAIVDPNAEVDPAFTQWNLETKDGGIFAGVIAAENPATITLKSLAGVQAVRVADLKKRENTGRSLMPEGFDGLGGETLRDIIAYMQSVDGGRFRTIDLRAAFTATTGAGLYISPEAKRDTLDFAKTGNVAVAGVPFDIVSADKAPLNIIVLRGGPEKSFASTLPPRVEIRLGGFTANRLHFLGGVAGWGSKGNRPPSDLVKATVHYADGQTESLVFRDGVEFADYVGPFEVPGSKLAEGLVKSHQLRWFSKQLGRTAPIEKLVLEAVGSGPAATFVAITAELADPQAAPLPAPAEPMNAVQSNENAGFQPQFTDAVPEPPATRPTQGPRVLLVGGGSSHDFVKFFGGTDQATLAPGVGWVAFTQNLNGIPAILDRVDVLVLSANQPISSMTKKALLDFANAGKGLVALHPGTWYAWNNFPEWNAQIVGGGTRGHDKLGLYPVTITDPTHPVTAGVARRFEITDELYNYTAGPTATPIEVLATATSPTTGKTFPQVFVVQHPRARIVGLTLGHDERAHDLPAYQQLLRNAVKWVDEK